MRIDERSGAIISDNDRLHDDKKVSEGQRSSLSDKKPRTEDIDLFEQAMGYKEAKSDIAMLNTPFSLQDSNIDTDTHLTSKLLISSDLKALVQELGAEISLKARDLQRQELCISFSEKSILPNTTITLSRDNEGVLAILINCNRSNEEIKKIYSIKQDLITNLEQVEGKINLQIVDEHLALDNYHFHNKLLDF